jgi:hypothetical protein
VDGTVRTNRVRTTMIHFLVGILHRCRTYCIVIHLH